MNKIIFFIFLFISSQSFAGWETLSNKDEFTGKVTEYGVYVKEHKREVLISCETKEKQEPLSIFFSSDIDLGNNEKDLIDINLEKNEGGVVEYNIDGEFGKIAVMVRGYAAFYSLPMIKSSYQSRKSIVENFTEKDFTEKEPIDITPLMKKGNIMRVKLHALDGGVEVKVIDLKGFTRVYQKVKKQCL